MISMVSIFLVLMLTIGANPAYNNGSASAVHPESTAGRININAKSRLGAKKIFAGIRGKKNPGNAGIIYKNKNKKSNSHRSSYYGYNNVHMKTYEQRGHNDNRGDVFGYDDVYRLTNVKFNVPDPTVPNPTEFEKEKTFNFDKLDNILSIVETQNEQTTTKTTQINSILNQYENFAGWGLSYDLNGNTTQKGTQHFTYNYRNQIIKAQDQTTEANYKYDALGRRVQKAVTVGSTTKTTNYYYSGIHVIEERDGSDNVINQYIYGNGIDEIIRMDSYSGATATPYYFHTNAIGSVTAITDANGDIVERVSYDTYGMPTFTDAAGEVVSKSTIGNTLLFHGRRYDAETNLYYFRARYYDPIMGRFLQTDPMGYEDSMNLYQGFNMNPVNFIDPFGLITESDLYKMIEDYYWELSKEEYPKDEDRAFEYYQKRMTPVTGMNTKQLQEHYYGLTDEWVEVEVEKSTIGKIWDAITSIFKSPKTAADKMRKEGKRKAQEIRDRVDPEIYEHAREHVEYKINLGIIGPTELGAILIEKGGEYLLEIAFAKGLKQTLRFTKKGKTFFLKGSLKSYERARHAAFKIMGKINHANRRKIIGKFHKQVGKVVGFRTEVGGVIKTYRIDWDEVKGAHINITIGKGTSRKKYEIFFEGSEDYVLKLLEGFE
ncbi:MAG: hypothetical protein GTO45_04610 [Candidatus Aminicenantes bacterium]|nr:hypothetical protein [Candidatus Aminicenantes bacterium]NIM78033.1 hypothetical protein [Candidatus Aminicenantes bacterium]NIN17353.1 hypothetical protein [Candidatus Aminicenantes bacterium]NIN41246.1 hypothetical protein [Candidatus Aminicenantes bacterium]NIN84019.1 hypothetical protein [Candidatus Aminicenantes bacterium]